MTGVQTCALPILGTTPTTEGERTSQFAANFKDPKTQFQAANAGSAFAAEMDKASKEQSAFNEQLAAYGGMNQGYQDLGQSRIGRESCRERVEKMGGNDAVK